MDKAARKKLNLKAIKRYDAAIVNILDQSPHAVLYHFSNERREWVKKSVEGVLFLVHRNAPPYFAVYIMNRLAMENYTLYLTDFDDMDLQENFIIYSTSDGERYAFWLYEEGDRKRLLEKINTLHDGIQKELSAKTNQKRSNEPNHMTMPAPPAPPPQQQQQLSSSSTTTTTTTTTPPPPGKASSDLLAMLQSGTLPAPPPPPPSSSLSNTASSTTRHHHPPNEYGPEKSEQQQSMMRPNFTDLPRMHWNTPPQPPPPGSVAGDPALEFSLPDAELMQPQQQPQQLHDPSGSHRLLELLKAPSASTSNHTTTNNTMEQQQGGDANNGNRLLDLLKRATIDDTKYMPSPPLPPASLGYPHPSGSSSTPNSTMQQQQLHPPHILFGKELTKAYQPPPLLHGHHHHPQMDPRRHGSPSRNSASLLQALQGGGAGPNTTGPAAGKMMNNNNNASPSPSHSMLASSSSSSLAALHGSPSSLPTLESELYRRLPPRPLSKPEFVHYLYDMMQNDPTFLDAVYDNYRIRKLN